MMSLRSPLERIVGGLWRIAKTLTFWGMRLVFVVPLILLAGLLDAISKGAEELAYAVHRAGRSLRQMTEVPYVRDIQRQIEAESGAYKIDLLRRLKDELE